jgi:hypothetical protein
MDGENDCAPLFLPNVNFYGFFVTLTVSQFYDVDDRMGKVTDEGCNRSIVSEYA